MENDCFTPGVGKPRLFGHMRLFCALTAALLPLQGLTRAREFTKFTFLGCLHLSIRSDCVFNEPICMSVTCLILRKAFLCSTTPQLVASSSWLCSHLYASSLICFLYDIFSDYTTKDFEFSTRDLSTRFFDSKKFSRSAQNPTIIRIYDK